MRTACGYQSRGEGCDAKSVSCAWDRELKLRDDVSEGSVQPLVCWRGDDAKQRHEKAESILR